MLSFALLAVLNHLRPEGIPLPSSLPLEAACEAEAEDSDASTVIDVVEIIEETVEGTLLLLLLLPVVLTSGNTAFAMVKPNVNRSLG